MKKKTRLTFPLVGLFSAIASCAGPSSSQVASNTQEQAPILSPVPQSRISGFWLAIGLNSLDANHYGGSWPLGGCEADANDMLAIAAKQGFEGRRLLTRDATSSALLSALNSYATRLKSGDLLVVSFSGHGGQVTDANKDEGDGDDETWCLYDRQVLDDELYETWKQFKPGVRVVIISDSCHSGTVYRAALAQEGHKKEDALAHVAEVMKATASISNGPDVMGVRTLPLDKLKDIENQHKDLYAVLSQHVPPEDSGPLACELLALSACRDDQFAADLGTNGLFSLTLKRVWAAGFPGSYRDFLEEIRRKVLAGNPNQEPCLSRDPWLKNQALLDAKPPFSIALQEPGERSQGQGDAMTVKPMVLPPKDGVPTIEELLLVSGGSRGIAPPQGNDLLVAARAQDILIQQSRAQQENSLAGFNFGTGIGASFDMHKGTRVKTAAIRDGVVRVEEEGNAQLGLLLETHYFWFGDSSKLWGIGPFVAIRTGDNDLIDEAGLGLMIGFRKTDNATNSFNIGIGAMLDPKARVLGDGFSPDAAPPTGATDVALKQEDRYSLGIVFSYTF